MSCPTDLMRGPSSRNDRVSNTVTLPLSPRAASDRPSRLSASSRIWVPPPCRIAIAAGLRRSAARRLLCVAVSSSSATPSRASSSARSSRGSTSACAPSRCAIAAVACRFAEPRAARAIAPAASASTRRITAAASRIRRRLFARVDAVRLSSRKSRSSRLSPAASPPASAHSRVAARRAPPKSSLGSRPPCFPPGRCLRQVPV